MSTGTIKAKLKHGKIDKEQLEQFMKKKRPGFQRYDFDWEKDGMVFMKAWKEGMPKDTVDLTVFCFTVEK